jgi:hypothetical protein
MIIFWGSLTRLKTPYHLVHTVIKACNYLSFASTLTALPGIR